AQPLEGRRHVDLVVEPGRPQVPRLGLGHHQVHPALDHQVVVPDGGPPQLGERQVEVPEVVRVEDVPLPVALGVPHPEPVPERRSRIRAGPRARLRGVHRSTLPGAFVRGARPGTRRCGTRPDGACAGSRSPGTRLPAVRPAEAHPSPDRNARATGTAVRRLDWPASTNTVNARSPRSPTNQACERGGVAVPYSAVPVLPATSPGRSRSRLAVPAVTTCRAKVRTVATVAGVSAGGGVFGSAGVPA